MSRTIKAIEPRMTIPVRSKTGLVTASLSIGKLGKSGIEARTSNFVAEWQQRGPEALSGFAVRKLRLAFVPSQSVIAASATG
jgi:hypothetical protein